MIKQVLESTNFYGYFKGSIEDLTKRWNESHRHFHTLIHLKKILDQIDSDRDKLTHLEYDILRIAAIYHDIIYLPREDKYNVSESIEKFETDFPRLPFIYKDKIKSIIDSTNYHPFEDEDKLIRMFNSYDMAGILKGNLKTLIEDGDNVSKEYHLEPEVYKKARIEFLEKYKEYNPNIQKCIDYLKSL
jgi:predicted metal-dependent HD superfamily phosphohydrolase